MCACVSKELKSHVKRMVNKYIETFKEITCARQVLRISLFSILQIYRNFQRDCVQGKLRKNLFAIFPYCKEQKIFYGKLWRGKHFADLPRIVMCKQSIEVDLPKHTWKYSYIYHSTIYQTIHFVPHIKITFFY